MQPLRCEVNDFLKQVRKLAIYAGITRISDITGLDRLGIHVYLAVRPDVDETAISVYNGKGLSAEEAELGAIMEGVERFSVSNREEEVCIASYQELIARGERAVDPKSLIISRKYQYSESKEYEWVLGEEILTGQAIWVPANCVYFPYYPVTGELVLTPNTDGVSAGQSIDHATLHGLLELIERDASSLVQYQKEMVTVDLDTIQSSLVTCLLEKFKAANISVHIKDLTTDIGIPVFMVNTVDVEYQLLAGGYGCHLNRDVALVKALLEAAQGRLTSIHGAREDLDPQKYSWEESLARVAVFVQDSGKKVSFEEIPSFESGSVEEDIQFVLGRLQSVNLQSAIRVDLTKKQLGLPAVRMIVPGLEESVIDPQRQGNRIRAFWNRQNQ